jgi:hypothetical protein
MDFKEFGKCLQSAQPHRFKGTYIASSDDHNSPPPMVLRIPLPLRVHDKFI